MSSAKSRQNTEAYRHFIAIIKGWPFSANSHRTSMLQKVADLDLINSMTESQNAINNGYHSPCYRNFRTELAFS